MRAGPIPLAEIRSVADIAARLRRAKANEAAAVLRLRDTQRAKLARQAEAAVVANEARRQQAEAERAATDVLVFSVLDPEKLAREPKRIIARVALAFGVTAAEVLGRSRTRVIVRVRWAAIAEVRAAHPNYSLPHLGRLFGQDHTTILNALRKMKKHGVPQPPRQGRN